MQVVKATFVSKPVCGRLLEFLSNHVHSLLLSFKLSGHVFDFGLLLLFIEQGKLPAGRLCECVCDCVECTCLPYV